MWKAVLLLAGLLASACGAPVNPQPNMPKVEEGTDPMNVSWIYLWYYHALMALTLSAHKLLGLVNGYFTDYFTVHHGR